jgi:hypothetical protein
MYIASVWSWEVLKWRPPLRMASRDGRRVVGPPRWLRRLATEAAAEDPERTLERVLCRLLRRTHPARHRKSPPKLQEQLILPPTLTNYNSVFMTTSQQHTDMLQWLCQ